MFNFREYIKKGFLSAVGKMSDYQIILNSAGYLEKGVLTEDDLAEINKAIEDNKKEEPMDELIENLVEDMTENEQLEEVQSEIIEENKV